METPNQQETRPTKIEKTWFLERGDGKIFACNELEAWNTMRNRSNWQRTDFKIIGVSDGKTYVEMLNSGLVEKNRIDATIAEKNNEITRFLNILDQFKIEKVTSGGDPEILKKIANTEKYVNELKEEVTKLQNEFKNGYQGVVQKAFDAELAIARGHIEFPRDMDVMNKTNLPNNAIKR